MTVAASATEPTAAPVVRPATVADVEALIALRTVMFHDVGAEPGPESDSWQGACRQILLDGFAAGDLIGAVAETDDGAIVAKRYRVRRR